MFVQFLHCCIPNFVKWICSRKFLAEIIPKAIINRTRSKWIFRENIKKKKHKKQKQSICIICAEWNEIVRLGGVKMRACVSTQRMCWFRICIRIGVQMIHLQIHILNYWFWQVDILCTIFFVWLVWTVCTPTMGCTVQYVINYAGSYVWHSLWRILIAQLCREWMLSVSDSIEIIHWYVVK